MSQLSNKKIFLEGNWTDQFYYDLIYPSVLKKNILSLSYKEFGLFYLNQIDFSSEVYFDLEKCAILSLESDIFNMSDEKFNFLLSKLSLLPPNISSILVCDYPFVKSKSIDDQLFEKNVYKRLDLLLEIISKYKCTKIAPAIHLTEENEREKYLDLFTSYRDVFDVWNLHCFYDFDEQKLSSLTGFLNQTLSILHKPVWITKCAVPSYDSTISASKSIMSSWQPTNSHQAIAKFNAAYRVIEQIANNDTKWFFAALGKDKFLPNELPDVWTDKYLVNDTLNGQWNYSHFLGFIDYQGQIKETILTNALNVF